jgi:hypothetical protein
MTGASPACFYYQGKGLFLVPSFRGIYVSTLSPIVIIINRGLRGGENADTLFPGP